MDAGLRKDVRAQMDDLGLRCYSTHNGFESFSAGENMSHAIELNQILGVRYIVLASAPGSARGMDGWKKLCEDLTAATSNCSLTGCVRAITVSNHRQSRWHGIA